MSSYSKILSFSRQRKKLISLPGAKRPHRLPPGGGSAVRRWRRARANHFIAHSPPRTNSISLFGGLLTFLCLKEKLQKKQTNLRFDRRRPSIVPPQATFPQICGALSDFSAPRNHKILKLCSRKDSVNLTVAWCEPEPYHSPCAPRAVWAQTGLVRGDSRLPLFAPPTSLLYNLCAFGAY